jgi:16S rRNA processing protein RimM
MLRPFQVRGMRVVLPDGRPLGEVVDVLQMPAQDLLVVRGGGREHLIPNVAPIVRRVDTEARCVEVDPPDGLLDLES